ncbi:MAG: hypothetical protein JXA96_01495 [Sedimentisphaerales bacterium]|nr:hypothetical protein [Sedimentisphaerales bacterium]
MENKKNTKKKNIIKVLYSDRTARTLFFAIISIIIMGSLRPKKITGMHEKKYWATKISWIDYADAIVTGDSRILGGISPGTMEETLKDRCIVNYGFASNLYDTKYLDAIGKVLRKNSNQKTIILGITPHSLTDDPGITGQFLALKSLSKKDIYMHMHFASLYSFFEYMSFHDAMIGLFPNMSKSNTHKELFSDGWLAYSKKSPGKKKELKNYLKIYERCQINQDMIDNLMEYVSKWSTSDIKVYGFLVPTCKEMFEIEEQYSGFNLSKFKQTFQNSGGRWIEIDPTAYDSFDGSHLQRESAVQLSKDLALKIFEREQQE